MNNDISYTEKMLHRISNGKIESAKEMLTKILKKKCADKMAKDLRLRK